MNWIDNCTNKKETSKFEYKMRDGLNMKRSGTTWEMPRKKTQRKAKRFLKCRLVDAQKPKLPDADPLTARRVDLLCAAPTLSDYSAVRDRSGVSGSASNGPQLWAQTEWKRSPVRGA